MATSRLRVAVVIFTDDCEICSNRMSGGAVSEALWPRVITVEDSPGPAAGALWGRSLTMIVGTNSAGCPDSTTAMLGCDTEYQRRGS